jgi:hypothetical protein
MVLVTSIVVSISQKVICTRLIRLSTAAAVPAQCRLRNLGSAAGTAAGLVMGKVRAIGFNLYFGPHWMFWTSPG